MDRLTQISWQVLIAVVAMLVSPLMAEIVEEIKFDVSEASELDHRAPYIAHWKGTSPDGVTFTANKTVILKDGKPFPVASGEFHPQRYPAEFWEEAILEMKAGGLNVIAGYWFWSMFEPQIGQFDFTGQNDIRRFMKLCKKHNVLVFVRIGPFNNAEFLHGGLPPWLFGMPYRERSNDPGYLKRVEIYYNELGKQLNGMMWDQGGPIYMVQVENELSHAPIQWYTTYRHGAAQEHKGPEDGEEMWKHYRTLQDLARNAGFNAPFYTITAWGPQSLRNKYQKDGSFLFAYGGYMYLGRPRQGQNAGHTTLNTDGRVASPYPTAFIELGAAGTPQRVPYVGVPPAESAECTGMWAIGPNDSIMCGWYMYHGGTNPRLPGWGLAAKRDEFGISYDYNAPLSEYGYERPAYYLLRRFHQTLLNYADRFCYGEIFTQNPRVRSNDDLLRASIRMGDTDGGMLFILHYGNQVPLSDRKAAFSIKSASGMIQLPREGHLKLTNGDFAILPFNWDLGDGVKLISSTAQPSGHIVHGNDTVMFCSTLRGQQAELVFELPKDAVLRTTGKQKTDGKQTVVTIEPALDAVVTVEKGGKRTIFAVLPAEAIYRSVEDVLKGQKTYLITNEDLVVNGDSVRLAGKGKNHLTLLSYPPVHWKGHGTGQQVGLFGKVEVTVPEVKPDVRVQKIDDKKTVLQLPESGFSELNDIYANIQFEGLVCRIFDLETGMPVGDQLYAEELDWNVGLKRFRKTLAGNGILFYANPADSRSRSQLSRDGMTLEEQRVITQDSKILDIRFIPEYRVVLEVAH